MKISKDRSDSGKTVVEWTVRLLGLIGGMEVKGETSMSRKIS